jgi:hypothetical protein
VTLVNGKLSNPMGLTYGVPQGSILGPLMFIVYVNDMSVTLGPSGFNQYADDTCIYYSDTSLECATKIIQSDLAKILEWSVKNKLTLNIKKTKFMVFSSAYKSKIPRDKIDLWINKTLLKEVNEYKYLGITLDSSLNYKVHINSLLAKVNARLGLLRRIRYRINHDTARVIYLAMIRPYIDYADIIYEGAPKNLLGKLQKLQNTALRIIINVEGERISINDLHSQTNITNLVKRREGHLLNFMYKKVQKRGHELMGTQTITRMGVKRGLHVMTPKFEKNKKCFKLQRSQEME